VSQVGFYEKKYMSPSMMRQALQIACAWWDEMPTSPHAYMFDHRPALVRIQWTGPWTESHVVSKKWAYLHTHWITTWAGDGNMAFDCNGGVMPFEAWENDIPQMATSKHPRADGGWFPTDVWRIKQKQKGESIGRKSNPLGK
jgi:hypothetical protein